jgi:hypothetical protein
VLAVFTFIVLLGPVESAPLTIDLFGFDTSTCPVQLEHFDGTLSVNVCGRGGKRLVATGSEPGLKPSRPNPAGQMAEIEYQVIERGATQLDLVDMAGPRVARLVDDQVEPGRYSVQFDTSRLPPGPYLCILRTPTQSFSRIVQVER